MSFWGPNPTANATVAEMVQKYPQLAADVEAITAQLRTQNAALQQAIADGRQTRELDIGVRDLRAKAVVMRTAFFALRDQWRTAIAEARRRGTMNAADYARLQDAGLAGLGFFTPDMIATPRSTSQYGAVAAAGLPAGNQAPPPNQSGWVEDEGMGVLFVIGWPLAVAIAAILAPAAFIAAYSLTAEARGRAQAAADQNQSIIDAWNRRVENEEQTGTPSLPLPNMPEPPSGKPDNSIASKVTKTVAAAGVGGLVVIAIAAWVLLRRKGK